MKILLYKRKGFFNSLIRWQTRAKLYTHAAFVDEFHGKVYEAMQGKGVICRAYDSNHDDKPTDCDIFTCAKPLTRAECDTIRTFLIKQVGKSYDWPMIFGFVTRRSREARKSSEKWFCSELVSAALELVSRPLFRNTHPWEIDPDMIAQSFIVEPINSDAISS